MTPAEAERLGAVCAALDLIEMAGPMGAALDDMERRLNERLKIAGEIEAILAEANAPR